MKLEGGRITNGQFIFIALAVTLTSSLLATPAQAAGHDAWLAILAGLVQGILYALVYTTLAGKFPGKTLIQFNDIIYGPLLGKVISLGYLLYFTLIVTLGLRIFGDFFAGLIFPQTPMVVFLTLIIVISASAVRNGIEVISRCAQILIPLVIFSVLITIFMLIKDINWDNFFPIMDIPLKDFLRTSFYVSTFPFGENIIFLMVFAYLNKQSKLKKTMLIPLILGGLLLTLTSIRNTGILGISTTIATYPSYQATRLINIGNIITRVEIIVAINFLATGFLGISIFYYGTVLGLAQLLNLRTYLPLVLPLGIILIVFTNTQFISHMDYIVFSKNISPYLALPFQIGIPLLSLLIATIRKLPQDRQNGSK